MWEITDNVKGPKGDKGDPGSIGSASAATIPPGEPAEVILTGETDVHAHFKIPRGEQGKQGPPGVASSASAVPVPYGAPPAVVLSQEGELVHARFEIPSGAPGVNAVPTEEAVGSYLAMPSSPTRPGLEEGLAQIANDPQSEFAVGQKEKLDAGLQAKADLVGGRVPDSQVGAATSATVGTLPKRGAGGVLPGIAKPVAATDAANKAYVDVRGGVVASIEAYGAVRSSTVSSSPAFKSAIAFLVQSGGGTLVIPPGEWAISETICITGPGITVDARGATIHKRNVAEANMLLNITEGTNPGGYNGNGDLTVLGGVWDAHGELPGTTSGNIFFFMSAKNIRVQDAVLRRGKNAHAIELNAIDGAWIERCVFEGFYRDGTQQGEAIQIDANFAGSGAPAPNDNTMCQNITIRACVARGIGEYGKPGYVDGPGPIVGSHSRPSVGGMHSNILVDGCTSLYASGTTWASGIGAFWWQNATIQNCTIIGPALDGVRVCQSDDVLITGCTVIEPGGRGIIATSAFGGTPVAVNRPSIMGNSVQRPGVEGIQLFGWFSQPVVEGNRISMGASTSAGISVVGDGTSSLSRWAHALVQGNSVLDVLSPAAISVGGYVQRVAVTGNSLSGRNGNTGVGINAAAGTGEVWGFGNFCRPNFSAATGGTVSTTPNYT